MDCLTIWLTEVCPLYQLHFKKSVLLTSILEQKDQFDSKILSETFQI